MCKLLQKATKWWNKACKISCDFFLKNHNNHKTNLRVKSYSKQNVIFEYKPCI